MEEAINNAQVKAAERKSSSSIEQPGLVTNNVYALTDATKIISLESKSMTVFVREKNVKYELSDISLVLQHINRWDRLCVAYVNKDNTVASTQVIWINNQIRSDLSSAKDQSKYLKKIFLERKICSGKQIETIQAMRYAVSLRDPISKAVYACNIFVKFAD